jgi:hypothetical protein
MPTRSIPAKRLPCRSRPESSRRDKPASHRTPQVRSLIPTSNRGPADWYPPFPNPVVAESLLDQLINTSHQVFMNGPSYRPNESPGASSPSGRRTSGKQTQGQDLGNYLIKTPGE